MYSMVYNGSLQIEVGSNLDQLGKNLTHHVKSQVFATKVKAFKHKNMFKNMLLFQYISISLVQLGPNPSRASFFFSLPDPWVPHFVISSSWFPKHAEPMLPVITRMLPTKRCLALNFDKLGTWRLPKQDPLDRSGSSRNGVENMRWKSWKALPNFAPSLHRLLTHLVNFSLRMKGANRAFQTTSRPWMLNHASPSITTGRFFVAYFLSNASYYLLRDTPFDSLCARRPPKGATKDCGAKL